MQDERYSAGVANEVRAYRAVAKRLEERAEIHVISSNDLADVLRMVADEIEAGKEEEKGGVTGIEAIDSLPPSIRVGPFDYRIEVWTAMQAAGERKFGACSTCEQKISIQRDMPTAVKAADTLLHEALHAIFWVYNIQDEDKEERSVGILAVALVALHRDNPWLAGWISDCTKAAPTTSENRQ